MMQAMSQKTHAVHVEVQEKWPTSRVQLVTDQVKNLYTTRHTPGLAEVLFHSGCETTRSVKTDYSGCNLGIPCSILRPWTATSTG